MITALLILHSFLVLIMIGVILLQKGESGGFVSSQTNMMTARGTKNFLTRTTAIFATLFFANALFLALLIKNNSNSKRNILKAQESLIATPTMDPIEPSTTDLEKPLKS